MDTASWNKAREAVVAAALPHVPFDGWSERALVAGARAAGKEASDAQRLFPRGFTRQHRVEAGNLKHMPAVSGQLSETASPMPTLWSREEALAMISVPSVRVTM